MKIKCTMCGGNKFVNKRLLSLEEDSLISIGVTSLDGVQLYEDYNEIEAYICTRCGHVELFATDYIEE